MFSNLQLRKYILDRISIEAADHNAAEEKSGGVGIGIEHEKYGEGSCTLRVKLSGASGSFIPRDPDKQGYDVDLQITGWFEVNPKLNTEQRSDFLRANAPAILYGIARSVVAQTSGVMVDGPLFIPSMNFLKLVEDKERQEVASSKNTVPPKKSAKRRKRVTIPAPKRKRKVD